MIGFLLLIDSDLPAKDILIGLTCLVDNIGLLWPFHLELVVDIHAGTGRNLVPDNDVFLSPRRQSTFPELPRLSAPVVSWKEAAERKLSIEMDALVKPRRIGLACAGCPPRAIVSSFTPENIPVDLLFDDEVRITDIRDLDLAQHLTNNDTDMLVMNLHTLEAIHLLDLIHEITHQLLLALDLENVMGINGAITELIARLNIVSVANEEVFSDRNRVFVIDVIGNVPVFIPVPVINKNDTLVLGNLALDADRSVNFGNDGRILRSPPQRARQRVADLR